MVIVHFALTAAVISGCNQTAIFQQTDGMLVSRGNRDHIFPCFNFQPAVFLIAFGAHRAIAAKQQDVLCGSSGHRDVRRRLRRTDAGFARDAVKASGLVYNQQRFAADHDILHVGEGGYIRAAASGQDFSFPGNADADISARGDFRNVLPFRNFTLFSAVVASTDNSPVFF